MNTTENTIAPETTTPTVRHNWHLRRKSSHKDEKGKRLDPPSAFTGEWNLSAVEANGTESYNFDLSALYAALRSDAQRRASDGKVIRTRTGGSAKNGWHLTDTIRSDAERKANVVHDFLFWLRHAEIAWKEGMAHTPECPAHVATWLEKFIKAPEAKSAK